MLHFYRQVETSDAKLDILDGGGELLHVLLRLRVDGLQGTDGVGRTLDVGDALVQVLVQVLHLRGEVLVEGADLFLEGVVIGEDGVDLVDIVQQHADGGIGGGETALRVLGEFADLLGDDGEAAACLAGAGGLDGGVQREQVRLGRDFVDHLHHVVDLLRILREHIELRRNFAVARDELVEEAGLLIDAAREFLDGVLDNLDVVGHVRDGLDDGRHLLLVILEHLDDAVLEVLCMFLAIDDALQEEGTAVRIDAREFVQIGIVKGRAGRGVIEGNGRQRLVDVQACNLAEAGEAGHGDVAEDVDVLDLLGVAEAAQDAVIEDAADGFGLALTEALQVALDGLGERLALHEVECLTRDDIAEKFHAVVGFVDAGNRADEVFVIDARGKGVLLHLRVDFIDALHVEVVLQGLDEGYVVACLRVDDGLDITQGRVGAADLEAVACRLGGLRLQDAVAVIFGEAHERDDGVVLAALLAVEDVGVLEVHLAARAAADEGAGELAAVVECLQHERLTAGYAVDVDEGEGVVHADAERDFRALDGGAHLGHAIGDAHLDLAGAQIAVRERQGDRGDVLDHAMREGLQQYAAAVLRCLAVDGVLARLAAELARGRHEDDLAVGWRQLLQRGGDRVHIEVRRDEAEDQGGALWQITEVAHVTGVEFLLVQIGCPDIGLAHPGRARQLDAAGRARHLCGLGSRGSGSFPGGEKIKHEKHLTHQVTLCEKRKIFGYYRLLKLRRCVSACEP